MQISVLIEGEFQTSRPTSRVADHGSAFFCELRQNIGPLILVRGFSDEENFSNKALSKIEMSIANLVNRNDKGFLKRKFRARVEAISSTGPGPVPTVSRRQ